MILTCIYSAVLMWQGPALDYVKTIPVKCELVHKSETIGHEDEVQQYLMDCTKGLNKYDGQLSKKYNNLKVLWFSSEDCYNIPE